MAFTFLLLHIVFASAFTLAIKWSQNRGKENIVTIGAINYIIAAIAIVPEFVQSGIEPSTNAMLIGGSMGAVYFINYFFAVFAIRHAGAASATVVSVLSIIVPIGFGVLVWNESPNTYQLVGIVLAFVSLLLIGGQSKQATVERHPKTALILLVFFALCGFSRVTQEAFKHICEAEQRPTFLIAAFAIASVPSVIVLLARWRNIKRAEVLCGLGMGVANILQVHFILKSLQFFPGYVVFPFTSAGAVCFTTIVATLFLTEKLNRRTTIGISISVVALFLLRYWG